MKHPYSREEIDALAAYCPDLDCCYFLPLERFPPRILIQLRLSPARNNQVARVNWAADYAFEALTWSETSRGEVPAMGCPLGLEQRSVRSSDGGSD